MLTRNDSRARPSRLIHRAPLRIQSASTRIHLFMATADQSTSASRITSTTRRSTFSRRFNSCRYQSPTIQMTVQQPVHPFYHCLSTQKIKQGAMLARHTSSHMPRGPTSGLRPTNMLLVSCSMEDLVTQTQRHPLQVMQVRAKATHSRDLTAFSPTLPRMLLTHHIEDRGPAAVF